MNSESPKSGRAFRFASFSLRDLLLITAIVAVCLAWWIDRRRPATTPPKSHDVVGPVFVNYQIRISSDSRATRNINGVTGIDFIGGNIVIHGKGGGTVIPPHNLIEFNWVPE